MGKGLRYLQISKLWKFLETDIIFHRHNETSQYGFAFTCPVLCCVPRLVHKIGRTRCIGRYTIVPFQCGNCPRSCNTTTEMNSFRTVQIMVFRPRFSKRDNVIRDSSKNFFLFKDANGDCCRF